MQRLAIEISGKIVDVAFDFFAVLAERWIGSDADRDRVTNAVEHNLSGINSVRGQQRFDIRKIRGGKTDPRPAASPLPHDTRQSIGMSQQLICLTQGSLADEFANAAG